VAVATGFLIASGQFRVSGAVRKQGAGDEDAFVNRHIAHLARPIGPVTQSLEGAVNIVQR